MNIIPRPQKSLKLGGEFALNDTTKVFSDEQFSAQAQRFVKLVQEGRGIQLEFAEDITQAQIIFTHIDNCKDEGYLLMMSEGVATVSATTESGCYYAVETLRQLLNLDNAELNATCNNCYIEDFPKFGYRGLSVDICRHFFPLSTLKQIVDLMARVKLNKLHLHLSDDQGFRFEIEKYPLLNSISSVRSGSEVVVNGEHIVDDNVVSGYLTKADARELVEYAAENQIEVIPELDVPGHAVAMLAAYPQYSCKGEDLEVRKKWGISNDILCAGNEETYTFIKDILDEICEVFTGKFVHLGGDEAPKDRWCNCKKCREKVAELKLSSVSQLQSYMVDEFRKYLEEKGKQVICWNDGVTKDTSSEIISEVWKPFTRSQGIKQANKGRKVIMAPFVNMYFDYPYAMTPIKKTFKLNPTRGVKKRNLSNVLGVEGAIWTEYIATEDKLYFNLLPRMLALSECAWGHNKGNFAKRCEHYVPLYDKLNLTYNHSATQKNHRNLRIVKEFFNNNSDVELDNQNNKTK